MFRAIVLLARLRRIDWMDAIRLRGAGVEALPQRSHSFGASPDKCCSPARTAARHCSAVAHFPHVSRMDAVRLRGGRQGWAATLASPARDFVPWISDSMLSLAECLARMPTGNSQGRQIPIKISA
jgi:hypothetical protein